MNVIEQNTLKYVFIELRWTGIDVISNVRSHRHFLTHSMIRDFARFGDSKLWNKSSDSQINFKEIYLTFKSAMCLLVALHVQIYFVHK